MANKSLLLLLAGAVLICGCDKQTKINSAKIDALSEKVVVIQQVQSKQLAEIQAQLSALGPAMDKINGTYFEKNHEDAFFFHTNTLYLLLLVERKIEAELQTAATERHAEHDLAYAYHTNQLTAAALAVAQLTEALAGMEGRLQTNATAGTRQVVAAFTDELVEQIKASAPDAAAMARQQRLADDVAQLKSDLARIKIHLGITNPPALRP